jgi:UDP-sulfoquinovose synthase
VEKEEHYYNAKHTKLIDLGLKPHFLSDTLVESVFDRVRKSAAEVDIGKIMPTVLWNETKMRADSTSSSLPTTFAISPLI